MPLHSLIILISNNAPGNIYNVINERGIGVFLHNFYSKKTYSDVEINETYDALLSLNNGLTNKEHVKNIKQTQKIIDSGTCPVCGGTLVLRKSKNGSSFHGCSNYPKCKFTKNK